MKTADRFVQTENGRLHYLEWGSGERVLLFLTGLGDCAYIYSRFAPRFADDYRVLALTRRGFGSSETSDVALTLNKLVGDIHVFLGDLGVERCSIIGHSISDGEMTAFATEYPKSVRELVYLDAAYIRSSMREWITEDPIGNAQPKDPPDVAFESADSYLMHLRRKYPAIDRMWSPFFEEYCREQLIEVQEDGTIMPVKSGMDFEPLMDSIQELHVDYSEIDVDILCIYVRREEHPGVSLDMDEELRRRANLFYYERVLTGQDAVIEKIRREKPEAEIVVLDGAEHHCYISDEDEVYRIVRKFLDRNE